MNINEFKTGQVLVRVERAKSGDGSWLGEPLVFREIANNHIYFTNPRNLIENQKLFLHDWKEGWEVYKEVGEEKNIVAKDIKAIVKETLKVPDPFKYTDNPRLQNEDDLYYSGCGCTWGTDLDGVRYWKLYKPYIMRSDNYRHLSLGDIINEKARIKKLIKECLSEMDY